MPPWVFRATATSKRWGVTTLNGIIGAAGQQAANYATTYLTGTGLASGGGGWGFDLNVIGSATDTFTGDFGNAANNAGFQPDRRWWWNGRSHERGVFRRIKPWLMAAT